MLLKTTREIIGLNYHALSLKAVSCVQLVRAFSGHPSIFLILFLLALTKPTDMFLQQHMAIDSMELLIVHSLSNLFTEAFILLNYSSISWISLNNFTKLSLLCVYSKLVYFPSTGCGHAYNN